MGYKIAIYPVTSLYAATKNVTDVLAVLMKDGTNASCAPYIVDFPAFNELIGLKELRDLEKTFI